MKRIPTALRATPAHCVADSESFAGALAQGRYQGYVYAYPHKTSYRAFDKPFSLDSLWAGEDRGSLFLYVHIPFCEMRCGFCNLFTSTNRSDDAHERYVAALERQARIVRAALGSDVTVGRMAVGGGTPTLLDPALLSRVLQVAVDVFGCDVGAVATSVETSPSTAVDDRLDVLADYGVHRVSIGVQSFVEAELRAMGRPQSTVEVHRALERIRDHGFAIRNVDLIYGADGQDSDSFARSIAEASRYEPEEVFLYPLYVRPLTGLGRNSARQWDDDRLRLYQRGRDVLLANGYRQVSMRMFRRSDLRGDSTGGPDYDCQRDAMLGLGSGARSYTSRVHYSSEYAVGRLGIASIIDDFVSADDRQHGVARYGLVLSEDDRRRRFVLQGLLQCDGLDLVAYRVVFGTDALVDVARLGDLVHEGQAVVAEQRLVLTEGGLENSDAIGPWLYGAQVRERMKGFVLR